MINMATSKGRVADDGRQTLGRIRKNITKGTIEKLFEDKNFVFGLIDILYEDGVDVTIKIEFLAVLEQYGLEHLDTSCGEQVTLRLLDLLQEYQRLSEYPRLILQILLTLTSLLIQHDMQQTEPYKSFVNHLWSIVCRVNDVASRQLRGFACQCLLQLETWNPRLLFRHADQLAQLMREERTHVFQDYATLLSTVLSNLSKATVKQHLMQPDRISLENVVPSLSYLMDNAFLFTPVGLWPLVMSVAELVNTTVHVAPTIFKPLMLQNLASLDPCMLHIILYIQKEFQGEILTSDEENQLLQRLTSDVNLLSLHPAQRLLILQWIKAMLKQKNGTLFLDSQMMNRLQQSLRPSVFDSLDIHIDKLNVLTHTYAVDQDQNLLKDIHYLKRLALTTGSEQASAGLYRILFAAYIQHQTRNIADVVIKITQDLVIDFPHLIPLILDFLLAIKEKLTKSSVYLATLSSLHSQVLSSGEMEVVTKFRFYLQVLRVSAKEPNIQQEKTIHFLLRLVRYAKDSGVCGWELGCAVLAICRNLMLHHCSDYLYHDLGELLFDMQSCFDDSDIRNHARLYYALLAESSDERLREVLGSKLLGGVVLSQNIANMLTESAQNKGKAEIVHENNSGLVLERLSVSPVFTSSESPSSTVTISDVKGRLESYYKYLACLHTHLIYRFKLLLMDSSIYEELHALSVQLTSTTDSFLPVSGFHLLSLSKLESKEIGIKLVPKLPQPTMFNIQIMFSTQDKTTVSTTLKSEEVAFTDLILPLPWQQLGVAVIPDKHCLFDELWTFLTRDVERSHGIESVKVLKCAADRIRQTFEAFHLPVFTGDKNSVDKFLLFLPPSYHLLLKLYPQGTSQVVSIATDNWKILPCISKYLNWVDSSA